MSAAPGTGTAIPARAATSRRPTTAIPSIRSWRAPGSGRRSTRPSPRSCATWATSPIATTSDATFASAPRSRLRAGTRPRNAGCSRPTPASPYRAATTSWRAVASPRPSRRRSTVSAISRARSTSPAAGRMTASSLPASASRSSARDRRASRRFRRWPSRRPISRCSSARRTLLSRRTTARRRPIGSRRWRKTAPSIARRPACR